MKEALVSLGELARAAKAVVEQSGDDIYTDAHECADTIGAFHTSIDRLSDTIIDAKRILLCAAINAKLAYWDAMKEVERMYGNADGDVSDKASDNLNELIGMLAAGTDSPANDIDNEHVAAMDEIFATYPL